MTDVAVVVFVVLVTMLVGSVTHAGEQSVPHGRLLVA